MRDALAAEHHVIAARERMHVVALTDAQRGHGALQDFSSRSARSMSSSSVILMLSGSPRTSRGCRPSASTACASSVGAEAVSPAARSARSRTPKRNICGVSARHNDSRATVACTRSAASARFNVSTTGAPSSPPTPSSASSSISLLKSVARRQGRAASCTSTQSSSAASDASARRPARTESTRSAPPVVVTTRGSCASDCLRQRRSFSASTTTMRTQSWRSRKGVRAHSMTLRPASCRYCFGRPAPARRRELPAAGTITQYLWGLDTGRVLRRHDLVEGFALADHSQVRARPLFDCSRALFQVLYFGSERPVALAQACVLILLRGDLRLQPCDFAQATVAEPQAVLDQYQQDQQ